MEKSVRRIKRRLISHHNTLADRLDSLLVVSVGIAKRRKKEQCKDKEKEDELFRLQLATLLPASPKLIHLGFF